MTHPSIPDEPARGTVDYYRDQLAGSVDVNDLHARSLGLIYGAVNGGDPAEQMARIDNILTVTNEVTRKLLGRPDGQAS